MHHLRGVVADNLFSGLLRIGEALLMDRVLESFRWWGAVGAQAGNLVSDKSGEITFR